MNVFYLGPVGTFSHKLAKHCCPNDALKPVENFAKLFRELIETENALGVVPVENSTSSNVHENIDFLFSGKYEIKSESYLKINLNLYGISSANLSEIKVVYSHSKAIEQCSNFISNHSLKTNPVESTANAIKLVLEKKDKTLAALGNFSDIRNLNLLSENIGNEEFNLTRFLHVTKKTSNDFIDIKGKKLSVVFKLPHVEGALSKVLTKIATLKINLSKIESKPIAGSKFEYLFWLDLEMRSEKLYSELLNTLNSNTKNLQIIGRYKVGKIYD